MYQALYEVISKCDLPLLEKVCAKLPGNNADTITKKKIKLFFGRIEPEVGTGDIVDGRE